MRKNIVLLISLIFICGIAVAEAIKVKAEAPFFPEGKPLAGLVITLDPGHGGSAHQPGYSGSARGVGSRVVEGDLNMLAAAELRWHLQFAGAKVHMTRWDDRKVTMGESGRAEELGARTRKAVESRSHLFLSLHHNSAPRVTADGVVAMYHAVDSSGNDQPLERAFAEIMREEVEKRVHHSEYFKPWDNDHPLVSGNDVPSVIIEFGFFSNPEFDAWVSRPGTHRHEAVGAYYGIKRMWEDHGRALETLRRKNFPDLPDEEMVSFGATSKEDTTSMLRIPKAVKNLAKAFWKLDRSPETVEEVNWIISQYSGRLTDSTFFYLRVNVEKEDDVWCLKGATNFPVLSRVVESLLLASGCESVRNEIELLPSDRLGREMYGVVRIPMALTWSGPSETSWVQTQLLLGEPVYLLDVNEDGSYLLLHGADGYIGWVRSEAVLRMDEKWFYEWRDAPRAVLTADYMIDDFRLPAGAVLPVVPSRLKSRKVRLRLPAGIPAMEGEPVIAVPADHLNISSDRPKGELAARAALKFLTVPYVFGGRSRTGIDCSGLTDVSYETVGLMLPRDARQQVLTGQMVATSWSYKSLQPGDLIFFCDNTGKVFHTGVSLGGMRFIHASPPEVHVSSFDPEDEFYSAEWLNNFAFARRPLP